MAFEKHGYADERFSHTVSTHFHCGICYNVLKEPVTCQTNEHYFCRACLIEHLKNSSTCPTCQQGLSPATITEAPQILRNCLDELNIRCDNSDRGCQEILQLAHLQNHVDVCGFSPVVCPNEGCLAEVNRQDLAAHQQALCEFRKCCDCSELKEVVQEIHVNTNSVNNQVKNLKNLKDINESLLAVKDEVSKTREDTHKVLHRLETLEEQVRATKEAQEAMKEAQEAMKEAQRLNSNNGETTQAQNILVAGGRRSDFGELKLVEIFNLYEMTWSSLAQMYERRVGASVFVSNGEITVVGGNTNHGPTETMTKIPISPDMKGAITWSDVTTRLPTKLYGHTTAACDGTLVHIGGCNKNKTVSKHIYRQGIVKEDDRNGHHYPPVLMPTQRCFHGTQVFGNIIFIFGGRSSAEHSGCLASVISFDHKEEKTKQLASLPYPVSEMATVRWGDNVILIGGADQQGKPLATVVIYNVKTEKWHILPPMNEKRKACSAVVIQNMIIVMGGRAQNNTCLRSVECFDFYNYTWQDFPAMITARERAVAVAF